MPSIPARAAGAVLAAAAVFSTVALAAPASAAPDKPGDPSAVAVSCGTTYPDKDNRNWPNFPGNYINIRSGPSTTCTALGQGQRYQRADYHCYVEGQGGTWTYLRNVSTGVRGWVRDDLLVDYGSWVHC